MKSIILCEGSTDFVWCSILCERCINGKMEKPVRAQKGKG